MDIICWDFLQMTFKRPATNRQITFEEISVEARLPISEVSSSHWDQLTAKLYAPLDIFKRLVGGGGNNLQA